MSAPVLKILVACDVAANIAVVRAVAFMAGELPPSRNRSPASSGIWNSVRNDCRR